MSSQVIDVLGEIEAQVRAMMGAYSRNGVTGKQLLDLLGFIQDARAHLKSN